MSETIIVQRELRSPLIKSAMLLGVLVIVIGVLGFLRLQSAAPLVPENYVLPQSQEIEARFGVRFTFIAVTANGGFIDLRYRIVDTGKASSFGHYTETSPMIINEKTGAIVDVTRMGLHNHRVEPGRIYYVLFRNSGDAIRRGDRVTIAVDDLEINGVIVQ